MEVNLCSNTKRVGEIYQKKKKKKLVIWQSAYLTLHLYTKRVGEIYKKKVSHLTICLSNITFNQQSAR